MAHERCKRDSNRNLVVYKYRVGHRLPAARPILSTGQRISARRPRLKVDRPCRALTPDPESLLSFPPQAARLSHDATHPTCVYTQSFALGPFLNDGPERRRGST